MSRKILMTALWISMFAAAVQSQSSPAGSKPLAVVNGETITLEQVKSSASDDLETLELHKLQAAAGFQQDEHTIYQRTLEDMVQDKLLELEAKKRGTTPETMIAAEVESKVVAPTDQEVSAFYEANKARISITGAEALRQVKLYLTDQRRRDIMDAFVEKLKGDYKVETFLEPLRLEVPIQGFPTKGPATAPVTIVEFSDFECPYCGALFPILKQIEEHYGDKLRIVYRQFPLTSVHPHAQKAAEASLCANEQQKFWELHDAMFQDNHNLDVDGLKRKASALNLDRTTFDACLDSSKYADAVKKDIFEGARLGVTGTPVTFINGRFVSGAVPYAELSRIIDEEIQKKRP
jgi:protein-disulfide isomerase